MHSVAGILNNHVLFAALLGWFFAQGAKIPIYYLVEHKWDLRRFFGSGGMPSSHTAMVIASAIMVGLLEGFDKPVFAVAVVLAFIVMYDATGVRRETGRQAAIINQILRDAILEGKPISDRELKELVGHKPIEVFGGVIVGLLVVGVYYLFILM